jgi:hypothetical protein
MEDISIPLIVRRFGVPMYLTTKTVTTSTDFAPGASLLRKQRLSMA